MKIGGNDDHITAISSMQFDMREMPVGQKLVAGGKENYAIDTEVAPAKQDFGAEVVSRSLASRNSGGVMDSNMATGFNFQTSAMHSDPPEGLASKVVNQGLATAHSGGTMSSNMDTGNNFIQNDMNRVDEASFGVQVVDKTMAALNSGGMMQSGLQSGYDFESNLLNAVYMGKGGLIDTEG